VVISHLHNFFLRSMPPLKMLYLKLRSGGEEQPLVLRKIIEPLALTPSLSSLSSSLCWSYPGDAAPLLRELTRETHSSESEPHAISHFALLPSLEEIVINIAYAEAPLWIHTIRARWCACGRELKSVLLSSCSSGAKEGLQFPEFNPGDDPARPPESGGR